ncbi:MAG: type VI secretion system baseplate subunit TssF [Gammaproteobacteria bacterium]
MDIVVLLNRADPLLENNLTPNARAVLHTSDQSISQARRPYSSHRQPRRASFDPGSHPGPLDFEVYAVTEVIGYGASNGAGAALPALYATYDTTRHAEQRAYYTAHRVPRLLSEKQRRQGPRTSYVGSEVFLALVDAAEAPYRSELRQLAVDTLCTNRDLPLTMPIGRGTTDFTLESGVPVAAVRCVAGPTKPRASTAEREIAWRLISHLNLNYLSLLDSDERQGAVALREMLQLYCDANDSALRKQIDGIRSVVSKAVTRRMPIAGPIAFGRGLAINVDFDESAFEGTGVFLLGSVLERFFAKYVSINTFTETSVRTDTRGEIMRWPVRSGRRHVL